MAAKFSGYIGYAEDNVEIAPGVFDSVMVERKCRGDIGRVGVRARAGDTVLPTLNISHEVSILADAYAFQNFHAMRYVNLAGVNWVIRQVEVHRPRLILRLGEVYNGPTP